MRFIVYRPDPSPCRFRLTPASGERLVREQEKEGDLTPVSRRLIGVGERLLGGEDKGEA